jgi:hypothetical protein
MRRLLTSLTCVGLLVLLSGCTTRADKDKNKDYDKPRTTPSKV